MTSRNNPIAQSVHDRLLSIAADRREDFNSLLARYVAERFLYRLTRTRHGKRFVLKGAMLFILWLGRLDRPTRDLDLLGSGEISEETLRTIFTDVRRARVKSDGLEFNAGSITVREIRENQVYQGFRVRRFEAGSAMHVSASRSMWGSAMQLHLNRPKRTIPRCLICPRLV